MPAALATELETEIQRLKCELEIAVTSQITPGAKREQELREQLQRKEHELFRQQEAESRIQTEKQRATDLAALCELEKRALTAKSNLDNLKSMYGKLASEIQRTEFEHGILLSQYSRLKQQIGV